MSLQSEFDAWLARSARADAKIVVRCDSPADIVPGGVCTLGIVLAGCAPAPVRVNIPRDSGDFFFVHLPDAQAAAAKWNVWVSLMNQYVVEIARG